MTACCLVVSRNRPLKASAPEHSTSKSRKTIMPPMTIEEAIETTKIHSICALLNDNNSFCTLRPFRALSTWGLLPGLDESEPL